MKSIFLRGVAALLALVVVAYVAISVYYWPTEDLAVRYDQADSEVLRLEYANGLDAEGRSAFYHTSQGSEIFPIRLLRALEDPATGRPFMENLSRFGLLPDPDRDDGLAVGLAISRSDFSGGVEMVGITCAACHVGEIRHNGRGVRIDGAPNMFDMQRFYAEMIAAAMAAKANPDIRHRVAQRLFAQSYSEWGVLAPLVRPIVLTGEALGLIENRSLIEARLNLARVIVKAIERRDAARDCSAPSSQCTSGYGRLDAFNGTRNFLLARLSESNLVPLDAAVKFPPLWGFRDFAWVEWTQNTNSVMERNITETLGAGATVLLEPDFDHTEQRFASSIPVRNLHALEALAYRLSPPAWPEDVLGPVDRELAARGEAVFAANCAGCHEYGVGDYDTAGLQLLRAFSPEQIGTDAQAARAVACPVADPGDLPVEKRRYNVEQASLLRGCFGVPDPAAEFEGYPFSGVIQAAVAAIKEKAYAAADVKEDERRAFEDLERRGDVLWRDTLIDGGRPYAARPLHGIWAAAPYLHNGSVPTLADLLSVPEERPETFVLGHREYDPVRIGYVTEAQPGSPTYVVDTNAPGNGNGGHLFGTSLLEEEKRALLEYLKTY